MIQSKNILQIQNVTKYFPGVRALDGVFFDLQENEIHGLLGQNGAGKSTLIKILSGVYSMTKGCILLDGNEINIRDTGTARKLGFSTVYQDTNLIESLSVAENLMLDRLPTCSFLQFIDRKALQVSAKALLSEVNLPIDPNTPVGRLTSGERQMVALAKVLFEGKRIIILDEPSTGLTSAEIKKYFNLMKSIKNRGLSMIYISHILDEVFQICDRITIIRDGKNVATRKTVELDKSMVAKLMVGRETQAPIDTTTSISTKPIFVCTDLASDRLKESISLKLKCGQILAVVGAGGSGEDVLAKLLIGVGNRKQGRIILDSQDITFLSVPERIAAGIAFIPPDRLKEGVFPNLSCLNNITLPVLKRYTKYGILKGNSMIKEVISLLSSFAIKASSPITEAKYLSGGNQQKLLISKWVNARSKLYIFCEPTAGVDVGGKNEIYRHIVALAKQGAAIIIVSHDLEEVFKFCHEIMVFYKGKPVFNSQIDMTNLREVLYYMMGGNNS